MRFAPVRPPTQIEIIESWQISASRKTVHCAQSTGKDELLRLDRQSMGNELFSGSVSDVYIACEIACHQRLARLLKPQERKAGNEWQSDHCCYADLSDSQVS